MTDSGRILASLASAAAPLTGHRAAIAAAYRRREEDCVAALLPHAMVPEAIRRQADSVAARLASGLRSRGPGDGIAALIHEYDLSSQEGVALMCLAEALLRIPDDATRDALIRDKIGQGDWQTHLGWARPLFVNAATWGLLLTGKLVSPAPDAGLGAALTKLIARGGEPVIRHAMDRAIRLLGSRFVAGETIAGALAMTRPLWKRGFRHSYDMLGEAAVTQADADRYDRAYEEAIRAIGAAAHTGADAAAEGQESLIAAPSISIKLSALHPRYEHAQRARVLRDVPPRLHALAVLARHCRIGLTIDAEEADRLMLSLDLLETLCAETELAGWDGIGFAVQAYQRRAPFVIDHLIDLARRSGHRLMIRLVKGAYWDGEIKRAQVDGLESFPVFTRKSYTDLSYIACARKMLDAPDAIFPQFATHNARTVATVAAMAGAEFHPLRYEFQCLHGMGEALYRDVVRADGLNRPCRVYAPVGTHETLLAYLVRRLLENGANTSFVNRVTDPGISLDALIADPAEEVAAMGMAAGAPHSRIRQPRDLYGPARVNTRGLDISDDSVLARLAADCSAVAERRWLAAPPGGEAGIRAAILNPAIQDDCVGEAVTATPDCLAAALHHAAAAAPLWAGILPDQRAACLERAADLLEQESTVFISLAVREAGRTIPNAAGEVREAADFLRYYAAEIRTGFDNATHTPLGVVACISPWNFPLAIFTGQIAAALAAGNAVLAKPAEETPLIAAQAVALLHRAGVPETALQLLPGDGAVGAALVADARIAGVVFTGSMAAARSIRHVLSGRLNPDGAPVPLIAETGGQNAMIVDSTALPEQVAADVLVSAFDSAGQRCSALRVLCIQDDIADTLLTMLRGALAERVVGRPDRLSTDIGPVISAAARDAIEAHIAQMAALGCTVYRAPVAPEAAAQGFFVAPAIVELADAPLPDREIFGPVLHVLRFRRAELGAVIAQVNATGYALTLGIHSRVRETIDFVCARSTAGNIYVNRSMIGAVVGVQPFGGHALSGTGPKAGGPLYISRLLAYAPLMPVSLRGMVFRKRDVPPLLALWRSWRMAQGGEEAASFPMLGGKEDSVALPGPVGEQNIYYLEPKACLRCIAPDLAGLSRQVEPALALGVRRIVAAVPPSVAALAETLPEPLQAVIHFTEHFDGAEAVLCEADDAALLTLQQALSGQEGPIVPVYRTGRDRAGVPVQAMVTERTVCINTAAAGGNASLMALD